MIRQKWVRLQPEKSKIICYDVDKTWDYIEIYELIWHLSTVCDFIHEKRVRKVCCCHEIIFLCSVMLFQRCFVCFEKNERSRWMNNDEESKNSCNFLIKLSLSLTSIWISHLYYTSSSHFPHPTHQTENRGKRSLKTFK